jgi:beta-xylosidase
VQTSRRRWRPDWQDRRHRLIAILAATTIVGGGIAVGMSLSVGGRASRITTGSVLDAPASLTTTAPKATTVPKATTPTTALPATANPTADEQPPPTSTPNAPGIAIATPGQPQPDYDLPDPSMIQVGSSYYLYLSTALGNLSRNITVVSGSPGNWDWADARDAMPTVPAWAEPNTTAFQIWEPEVFTFGSTYVMYTSPAVANYSPQTHCIGVATSNSPLGPFVPSPQPIVCQLPLGGDIDAQAFFDPSGPNGPLNPYYLVWKSENNNLRSGDRLTHIWAQGLSNNGLQLTGSPVSMFAPDEFWQEGLVEAPQFYTGPGGTLYLFYSGGTCFCGAQYGMGVARCASVFGPCTDLSSTPLITTNSEGAGPGEETVFVGPDNSVWLLYNPWYTGDLTALFRPVEATRIGFGPLGPYVAEAGTFPDPYPKLTPKHPVRPSG